MFTVILRSLIIFTVLILGVRLMGKRTVGEFQPYEFVITLAVADLACTPMQDVSVPLVYGVIPILVLFAVHYILTFFTSKSVRFRKFLNGKPMIVIDGDGINAATLAKLNLNVNDLLELIRQQGYFSIPEISYGVIETNGKLSVLKNEQAAAPSSVPMTLVVEGKMMDDNLKKMSYTKAQIQQQLKKQKIKLKDVLLMTVDSNQLFLQPKNGKFLITEVSL